MSGSAATQRAGTSRPQSGSTSVNERCFCVCTMRFPACGSAWKMDSGNPENNGSTTRRCDCRDDRAGGHSIRVESVRFLQFYFAMALQRVCSRSELLPGGVKRLDEPPIAVFSVEGSYFAISDVCTHEWARLSDGQVDGETVTCPLHGACFSLSTGEALSLPAIEPVETFAVVLQGDDIYVEL